MRAEIVALTIGVFNTPGPFLCITVMHFTRNTMIQVANQDKLLTTGLENSSPGQQHRNTQVGNTLHSECTRSIVQSSFQLASPRF